MKCKFILFIIPFLSTSVFGQQCPILFLSDLDPSSVIGYQFEEGWELQNISSSCNAVDYYLTPYEAEISYDNGNTWQPYFGMNLQFYRTSPPNQSNTNQSDRFSISAGQIDNLECRFNVSPGVYNVDYKIYFDIYDSQDNPLPPLAGGRLYSQFSYPQPFPNLRVTNTNTTPTTVQAGGNISVNCLVENIGYANAGQSTLQYWYSNDNVLDGSDIALGTDPVGTLQLVSSSYESATLQIPSGAIPGTRYIIFEADANETITELNESDNTKYVQISVTSTQVYNDITISDYSVTPSTTFIGSTAEVRCRHDYTGNASINFGPNVAYVLSTDCTFDAGDEVLDIDGSTIGGNDPSDLEWEDIYFGSNYTPGDYYILFVGDYYDEVSEVDESNNVECTPFTLSGTVDFYISNASSSTSTVASSNDVVVSCDQYFSGNSTENYIVYLGYYLSTDQTFDGSDIYLDDDGSSIGYSDSYDSESQSLTIPANTPNGQYYILIVTDHLNEIPEVNEGNNVESIPLTVFSNHDVTVNNVNISATTIEIDDSFTITCDINYTGNSTASLDAGIGYFLSSDCVFDGSDLLLDEDYSSLSISDPVESESESMAIPESVIPGNYYILIVADYHNEIYEVNENNNVHCIATIVIPDPSALPMKDCTCTNPGLGGDPINLSTGAYIWAKEDLSLYGLSGQFAWRRFYNSQNDQNGSLGWNWTHTYNIHLSINGSQWVVEHGNGQKDYFIGYDDGSTLPMYRGILDTLFYDGGTDNYIYEKRSGISYIFDNNGIIQEIRDRNDNAVLFSYTSGELVQITIPGGRYYTLSYTSGKITSVSDNTGRSVSYTYSASGDLISSIDVRGYSTTYTYDGGHRITSITDPLNNIVVQNTYDGNGRAVSQADVYNNVSIIAYDTPATGATSITNALGGTQIYYHNNRFRLTEFINELGDDVDFYYDNDLGTIFLYRNERNKSTVFDYDDKGNLIELKTPLGHRTNITYNNLNLPDTITNALGDFTTITYNSSGNPLTVDLPNGSTYTSSYNSNGQLIAQTRPNGNTTSFSYSSFGDLISMQTTTGTYSIAYDDVGRITAVTDRNGHTNSFTLDEDGNVTHITDPLGDTIVMTYDGNGNLTTYQDKEGHTTTFIYDDRNQIIEVQDPLNNSTFFAYDALGRKISSTDANGNIETYNYDAVGQLIQYTNDLGTYQLIYDETGNLEEVIDPLNHAYEISYDIDNRPTTLEDPLYHRTYIAYNEVNQPITVTDALGNVTQYSYTNMGWLESVVDALGGTTLYAYDLEGNLTSYTDANAHTTTITYNALNLPTTRIYPGNFTTTSTYDNEGNLLTQTDENGLTAAYTYNSKYDLTGISYTNGANYSYGYDKDSRLLNMTNANGTTTLLRDARGYITQSTDPFGYTTQYGYDPAGNRTSITYPGGNTVTTQYNAVYLPTQITDWLGNYSQRSYDANGHLTTITNSNGTYSTITRDELGRISAYKNFYPDNTEISSHALTYDVVGNITQIQPTVPLTPNYFPTFDTLSYGDDDRILTSGTNTYSTNANGARTAISGNGTENYTWGENDLLLSYTRDGTTTQNYFNPLQQRIQKIEGGQETKFILDINTSLSTILQEREGGGTVKNNYIYAPDGLGWKIDDQGNTQFYHFDFIGHTLALSDGTGALTDAYATDAFGDFYAHNGATQQPFVFLGKYGIEYEGNGHYHIRAREYDAANGRFWSKDMAAMGIGTQLTNKYIYGLNNPYSFIDVDGNTPINYGAGSVAGFNDFSFSTPSASLYGPYAYDAEARIAAVKQWSNEVNNTSNYTQTNPNNCNTISRQYWAEKIAPYLPGGGIVEAIVNTAEAEALIDLAETSIENGNYETANFLLGRANELLHDGKQALYKEGGTAPFIFIGGGVTSQGGKQFISRGSFLYSNWYKSTFSNITQSVRYHLSKHGNGRTAAKYTEDAIEFFNKYKHRAEEVILRDGTEGLKIIINKTVNGARKRIGGYFKKDGRIVTFWD